MRTQPAGAQASGPVRGAFAECPPAPARPEPVSNGKVNEALVWISDGLPPGDYPIPKEPVTLDQAGCEFSPRVFGIRAGQDLVLRNSDKALHNVHSLGPGSNAFNLSMPVGRPPVTVFFADPKAPATLTCDVHPWMRAYAGIMPHPFFAVTGPDGAFALRGLPAGAFTVSVWQERLGRRSIPVSLNDSQSTRVEISLDGSAP